MIRARCLASSVCCPGRLIVAPSRIATAVTLRHLSFSSEGSASWSGLGKNDEKCVRGQQNDQRLGPPQQQGRRPGDWDCPYCGHHVFAYRSTCPRCGPARSSRRGNAEFYDQDADGQRNSIRHKPGDWDCPSCFAHNFARRTDCFRCHEPKPANDRELEFGGRDRSSYMAGDWDCPSCAAHNYANRQACFRCGDPRPHDVEVFGGDSGQRGYYGGGRMGRY